MDDPIALRAQHEAELEVATRKTDPSELAPSEPTNVQIGRLGRALIGLDMVREYIDGAVAGKAVDVAQSVWGGLECKVQEVGDELRREIKAIRDDVCHVRSTVDEIAANLNVVVKLYRLQGARLSELEANCIEHHGAATPSATPEANEA